MITTTYANIKVVSSNFGYWSSLGYEVKKLDRKNKDPQIICVKVEDLLPNSNVTVDCKCDNCGYNFSQRYSRNKDVCSKCRNRSK
jgi:hypothetical protein